jgi:hypothetical protein
MVPLLQSTSLSDMHRDRYSHETLLTSVFLRILSQDDTLFVHYFILNSAGARQRHGTALPPQRFHGESSWRPDPRFVKWHYNQCIKARIRGFSIGVTPDEVFGLTN